MNPDSWATSYGFPSQCPTSALVNLLAAEGGSAGARGSRAGQSCRWQRSRKDWAEHGYALADIELLLLTHHHLDHAGLAQTLRERSGATVAAHQRDGRVGRGV